MGRVLKANQVRLEEPVQLDLNGANARESIGAHRPDARAHVRITSSDSRGALLEIACSCGKIIHVHCEYAAAAPAEPAKS